MAKPSETVLQELQYLRSLLQMEREEDYLQYQTLIQKKPLAQRIAEGLSWYPLQVIKTGYTIGERAYVVVQTDRKHDRHQFRAGSTVRFFTQQAHIRDPEKQGVIQFVERTKMKIILGGRDLPDWLNGGQIGVDLMFDDRTYTEMDKALAKVMDAQRDRTAELRDILLGHRAPTVVPSEHFFPIPELNPSQNEAVRLITESRDVAIIHGPPGTGKTTTLVHAIKRLSETETSILVSAPSNAAADLLTDRLSDLGMQVVRIGNISRVDEKLWQHTLEGRLSQHPEAKMIKKIRIEAAEARREAGKHRRHFDRAAADERRNMREEARDLEEWANQLEKKLLGQILDAAQVVTCTLVGAANNVLEKRHFRTVVIDEASQALEPATWIPILRATRVILAGDPFQLPPTVKSAKAQREGLAVTLLEKTLKRSDVAALLTIQYRMHTAIMGFSNAHFYGGALQTSASVDARTAQPALSHTPVLFIDTAGCGFDEKLNEEYQSKYNPEEFFVLREHLYQLLDSLDPEVEPPTIAIISPYREQIISIRQAVQDDNRLKDIALDINTIDAFQGQERDVVYISLVRSNPKGEIGFLTDYRRMNVALTRARHRLIVVGDSGTIGGQKFYAALLEYCEKHNGYETAWVYMG